MRFALALAAGTCVALLLFLLMHLLVGGREGFQRPEDSGGMIDFVRVRIDEVVQTRERRVPEKPPPPDEPPPPLELLTQAPREATRQMLDMEFPDISLGVTGGPVVAADWQSGDVGADGDIIPIVRIEPAYPRDALMRGIEGWVRVRFTILPDGSVADPVVVSAEPPRIFNREAIRAILRWKFRPRIVGGQAVSREAEQTIEFSLQTTSR